MGFTFHSLQEVGSCLRNGRCSTLFYVFIHKRNGSRSSSEPDAADNDIHNCLIKGSISGLFREQRFVYLCSSSCWRFNPRLHLYNYLLFFTVPFLYLFYYCFFAHNKFTMKWKLSFILIITTLKKKKILMIITLCQHNGGGSSVPIVVHSNSRTTLNIFVHLLKYDDCWLKKKPKSSSKLDVKGPACTIYTKVLTWSTYQKMSSRWLSLPQSLLWTWIQAD